MKRRSALTRGTRVKALRQLAFKVAHLAAGGTALVSLANEKREFSVARKDQNILNVFIQRLKKKLNMNAGVEALPMDELEPFSMEGLWNNFEKRSYQYERFRPALQESDPRLLHWIGSIDYSGYTREASVKYLIDNFVDGDENRLLLRLSDWVPEVQAHARRWVMSSFQGLSIDSIKKNSRLILFLSRKEVLLNDPAMGHINSVLLARVGGIGKKEFFTFDAGFRRYLYILSLDGDQSLRPWLLEDREPFDRLLLLTHPSCKDLTPTEAEGLTHDLSVFVRRRYIGFRVKNGLLLSRQELMECALHRNRGLRELGRFYLKKYYDEDAYDLYKGRQDNAFYYIADYARKADMAHFLKGVHSSHKQTRLMSLRALSVIDYQVLRDLDLRAFIQDNRKTREILCRHIPHLLSYDELFDLRDVLETSSSNGIFSYLAMIEKKSYWRFVDIALAELLSSPSPMVARYIDDVIRKKTAVYERLNAEQRDEINQKILALRSKDELQINGLLAYLEFIMGSASS